MEIQKKTRSKKLEFKIDASIIDSLFLIKNKLKDNIHGYHSLKVAGLCLLGEKDGVVDCFEPMLSNRGCWDVPEISHKQFYDTFTKLINKDRRVVGMAIIKPDRYDEKLVPDVKRNIRAWRKTFTDISQTIWIVISDLNIITYRPSVTATSGLTIRKISSKIWLNPENSKMLKIAEYSTIFSKIGSTDYSKTRSIIKNASDTLRKGAAESTQKRYLAILKQEIEDQNAAFIERKKKIAAALTKKEKVKYSTNIGNGLTLIKTSDGKEILWAEN